MRQAKLMAVAVLALFTLIVVVQNTEPVVVKVLFYSVTAPAALALFVAALAGFLIGTSMSFLLLRRREKTLGVRREG